MTIEERIARITAMEPVEPTEEERRAIEEFKLDDSPGIPLDEFMKELEGYSGKLVIRLPRSLHKRLKAEAEAEGVSLNQYMLYKLAQ